MLLIYRENRPFSATGRRLGVHHQTVQRCVERPVAYGPLAALDDRLRQGLAGFSGVRQGQGARLPARAVDDTTAGLHARQHGPAAGHPCLAKLVQGTVCKILSHEEIKPHKVRYIWNVGTPSSSGRWRRFCASVARSKS
jgi:hypothetical protein